MQRIPAFLVASLASLVFGASTAGTEESPTTVDPLNASYRLRLGGCLLGEQPLTLVLRMDRGRIVQSWAHPYRSNHPYVQLDVSKVRLDDDKLAGPITAIMDWNLYEMAIDSRIVSNKVTGSYKGRFGDVDVRDVELAVSGEVIPAVGDAKDVRIEIELASALRGGPPEARGVSLSLANKGSQWRDMRIEPLGRHATEPWKATVTESSLALTAKELTGSIGIRVSPDSSVSGGDYRFDFNGIREGSALAGMVVSRHSAGTNETGFIGYSVPLSPNPASAKVARMILEGAIAGSGGRPDEPKHPIWVFVPLQDVPTENAAVVSPVSMRVQSAFLGRLKKDGVKLAGEVGVVFDYDGQFPEGGEAIRCKFGVDATMSGDRLAGKYKGTTGTRRDIAGTLTGTVEPWPANAFREGDGWTGWRGPHSNGAADSTNHVFVGHLADARLAWKTEVTNLPWANWLWEEDRCPGGYSDFAFMSNSLYMAYAVPGERVINTNFFKGHIPGQSDFAYRIHRGMGTVSADDCLVSVDGPSGRTLWTSEQKDRGLNHWAVSAVGCGFPLITPWAEDGRVYSYGTAGRIYCRDGATGELMWESDIGEGTAVAEAIMQVFSIPALSAAYGASRPPGKAGRFGFPDRMSCTAIIAGDGVVACNDYGDILYGSRNFKGTSGENMARGCGAIGFDAATGRPLWRFDNCQTPSADTPIRWVHEKKTRFICVGPQRIVCVEPKTGRMVWEYTTGYTLLGGGTPAISGDYLLVQGTQSNTRERITERSPGAPNPFKGGGITCYKLSLNGPDLVWAVPMSEELFGPDASLLVYNGVVYGNNKGRDLLTGKPVMSHTFSMGYAPIGTDGYVVSGRLGIYPVAPAKMAEKKKESGNPLLRKLSGGSDWNAPRQSEYISPVVVDGRFFVRGWHELYCFDIRKERPSSATAPMPVEKGAISSTAKDYLDDLSSRFETRRRDAVDALLAMDKAQWPGLAAQLAEIVASGKWPALPAACDALACMGTNAAPAVGNIRGELVTMVREERWGSALVCADALAAVDRSALYNTAMCMTEQFGRTPMQTRIACAILARMGPGATEEVPAIAGLLSSNDLWVAEGAARTLADIGKAAKAAVPALAAELERNRPRVAVQCARALANIGGPEADAAAPELVKTFAADKRPLSTHAAIALATLTPESAKVAIPLGIATLLRTRTTTVDPICTAAETILFRAGPDAIPEMLKHVQQQPTRIDATVLRYGKSALPDIEKAINDTKDNPDRQAGLSRLAEQIGKK